MSSPISAFQPDAFQDDAFQIFEDVGDLITKSSDLPSLITTTLANNSDITTSKTLPRNITS